MKTLGITDVWSALVNASGYRVSSPEPLVVVVTL